MGRTPCTVEVGEAKKGETRARRYHKSVDKLQDVPEEGINTLYDVLQRSAKLTPTTEAIGYRDIIKMHDEEKEVKKTVKGKTTTEKKTWQYYELSPYKWVTYKQFADNVKDAASGLVELGMDKSQRFNVYSQTKMNWQVMAQACCSLTITFATSYDSLGEEGLKHSLNEPEAVGIFTNHNLLPTLGNVIGETPTIKYVIYDGDADEKGNKAIDKIKAANGGIKVLTLSELQKLGKEHPHDAVPPKSEDLACIMYTSGSTGAPKGVLISHGNIVAAIAAIKCNLGEYFTAGETYMAFLPTAHILEFTVEMACLYAGVKIGYGTIKTLTENSVRNCQGDIRTLRPTIMCGVPAVWELIRKGLLAKVKAGGGLKEKMFWGAVSAKQASKTLFGPITDAVVFKAVKQATGGRLRFAMNGGAGISKDTQIFLGTSLANILGGYGLTESCAMAAVTRPDYYTPGTVGCVMSSCEVKLVDFADAGYYATNNPPQGEIWIRGNSVTKGYFKREDTTKETITEDGWLMTGDIGQWEKDGCLSIIDRKKNLVKLSGGEYIAIERLEATYKGTPVVGNIMVHADPDASKPMAIVFPHEVNLKSFCHEKGFGAKDEDFKSLCEDDKVRDAVLQELNSVGKSNGFKGLELLQAVILTPEEWTPQNNLVTAAQKLNRKAINEKFKDEIKEVYP